MGVIDAAGRFAFQRGVEVPADRGPWVRLHRNALAWVSVYAIAYGIYEYFVVYKHLMWVVMVEEVNWLVMILGLAIVVTIATRGSIEHLVMGLMHTFLLEDLVYWLCQWVDTAVYPFPAPNWFDAWFASFRVLGGIGSPLPWFPHVPLFYLPGFAIVLGYYLAGFVAGPRGSRIVAWIAGPLFVAIIGGTMVPDSTAALLLVVLPAISYGYVLALLLARRARRLGEKENGKER